MPPEIDAAALARAVASAHGELPELPRDAQGPVFKAPWEAQAFAMTLALHEGGAFSWTEWADTLAEVIAEAAGRGDADDGEHYYLHWLTALERIATRKAIATDDLLARRRKQWEDAARRTPHGKAIEL